MKKLTIVFFALALAVSCKKKEDDPKPEDKVTYYVYSKSGKCNLYYTDGEEKKSATLQGNTIQIESKWSDNLQSAAASNTSRTASDSIYISATRNGKTTSKALAFKNVDANISLNLSELK